MKRFITALVFGGLFLAAHGQQKAVTTPTIPSYVPLAGGAMTGPLTNSSRITAKVIGPVLQADAFTGSDPSVQINACLQTAYAAGGASCDARMFIGNQSMSQTIEVLEKTALLLPHAAYWCWSKSDGTSVGVQQDGGSAIIGTATGGGGNNMQFAPCNASTNMLALYATQNNPNTGGQYIYASGFSAQNTAQGAKFSHGVIYTRYLYDESHMERVLANNPYGDAWHILGVCCDTSFEDVTASSSYGASGGTPLVVEGAASFGWSGTINAAGIGHPNIDIQAGNYQIDFWNLYSETNGPSADTSTPVVNLAGIPVVRFHGGVANMNSSKPCFSNPSLVSENDGWCGSAPPAEGNYCPWNGSIFGVDSTHLYVCAANKVKSVTLN